MKKNDLTKEQIKAIREAFHRAFEGGPWEESSFLRALRKRLEKIYDDFLLEVGEKRNDLAASSPNSGKEAALKTGQQEVFISVYSSNGNKLSSWEKIISMLPRQLISRPIYADEEKVLSWVKSKANPVNEAYVCAYISEVDIKKVPEDKRPRDKLNNPLMTVKDRCISLDNITRFVHLSDTYKYVEGRLVK